MFFYVPQVAVYQAGGIRVDEADLEAFVGVSGDQPLD
jgi:hypothetical protein